MDKPSITPEVLELLSRITTRNLRQEDVTPSVVFFSALISVILGVIYVDKTVRDAEKQQLQHLLNELAPVGSELRLWIQPLLQGIQQQKIYSNFNDFINLTSHLSVSEKLLLISLGYQFAAIDHHVHLKEKNYLMTLSGQLSINSNLFEVLEAGFCHNRICNDQILIEFKSLLKPSNFQSLDPGFINAAHKILAQLPSVQSRKDPTVSVDVKESVAELKTFIELGLEELNNLEKFVQNKPNIAQLNPQDIWLKISDCSGHYVHIQNIANSIKTETATTVHHRWPEWVKTLEIPLKEKWVSYPKPQIQDSNDQKQIAELYAKTFSELLKEEIASWLNQMITQHLDSVDTRLELISQSITTFSQRLGYEFGAEILAKINAEIQPDGTALGNLTEDLGKKLSVFNIREFASDVAGSVLGLLSGDVAGSVLGVLGGVAGVFFKNNATKEQTSIQQKVFEKGWENFNQSQGKILERIEEVIALLIDHRIEIATQISEEALHAYQELLTIQMRYQQESAEQQKTDLLFVTDKQQQFTKLKQELEAILEN